MSTLVVGWLVVRTVFGFFAGAVECTFAFEYNYGTNTKTKKPKALWWVWLLLPEIVILTYVGRGLWKLLIPEDSPIFLPKRDD